MPSRSVPVIFSCAIVQQIDTFLTYNALKLRMILDTVVNFDIAAPKQYQNQLDTIFRSTLRYITIDMKVLGFATGMHSWRTNLPRPT